MKIISHRGNLTGPNPDRENMSSYVREAVKAGFGVEVDLWGDRRHLFMGHDVPHWEFNPALFKESELLQIWFHCKNDAAEHYCKFAGFNHFRHEGMPRVTTYMGETWHYPGATLQGDRPIACLPETVPDWDISGAWGICTDYPVMYRAAIDSGLPIKAGMKLCHKCQKPAVKWYQLPMGQIGVYLCEEHKNNKYAM